ncbi:TOMM precursor leader peptide-binding protein [Leifsonia aquatica]|uniref:TOMM precursor leader peptide-binding protein n=1 Tax=Leifsonia aquatica TaxID=144185 RepID=UPI0013B368D4|nr:TOMM precursor leader peptide-binding protein [Leifsonia aquatica]
MSRLNETLGASSDGFDVHEIAERFGLSADELAPLLDRLVTVKMLVRHTAATSAFAKLAEASAGGLLTAQQIQANIDACRIGIAAPEGSVLSRTITTALLGLGLSVGEPAHADLVVVVGDSPIDPALFEFNRRALETEGPPWLAVTPFDGGNAWVGPLHIPMRSACYTCFHLRRSADFPDEVIRDELPELRGLGSGRATATEHPIDLIAAGVAVTIVSEWAALRQHAPSAAPGAVTTISVERSGVSLRWHRTLRVPRCPDCSPAAGSSVPRTVFPDEFASWARSGDPSGPLHE